MKSFRQSVIVAGWLAFASYTSAQVADFCPTTDVCFKLNIPESTASSGTGDIFFQLSAPSTYQWVGLGQGTGMSGSQIFVVYTSGDGNVTLSPRLGAGHRLPEFNSDAKVTLLEGSGVSNGKMVANVKCSSCNSWSGGTASFSEGTGDWIWGALSSGAPKDTTDQSAGFSRHDVQNSFQWNYANAKGGSSVNPLIAAGSSGTVATGGTRSCVPRAASTKGAGATGAGAGAGSSTQPSVTATATNEVHYDDHSQWGRPTGVQSWPTARPTGDYDTWEEKREEVNYCDDDDPNSNSNSNSGVTLVGSSQSNTDKMLIAHGAIAALVFAILFPFGAIGMRLASFTGLVWVHAAVQGFAYLLYVVAFGLGVHIANEKDEINKYHPIIGIVVFACLFFQPILGLLHHSFFKKHQRRTLWSHAHLWLGRSVITLGIINGGLGFMLADDPKNKSAMIAYSVIASVVWLLWVSASIIGERRRMRALANAPPKYTESPARGTEMDDVPHPDNGHYAPGKHARAA